MPNVKRPDRDGTHRAVFDRNKKKIYATQTICGICGNPVDFELKYPHPLSPTIDHIIPVAKGGHPSDISNLQLAHFSCNRQKSDKLFNTPNDGGNKGKDIKPMKEIGNNDLPLMMDWKNYKKENKSEIGGY